MIRPLDSLRPTDKPMAGAKAWGCARLRQAGFRVPDGFVVMASSDTPPESLDLGTYLEPFPPNALFAVRSSGGGEDGADASFAGIHSTLLNVPAAGVPSAVLQCMTSGRSALADSYRSAQAMREVPATISVLVQQMVPADVAGVAFTVDPAGSPDHVVINASWGLGEAVASGRADPDSFAVHRTTKAIVQRRLGEKRHCVDVTDGLAVLRETSLTDRERACLTDEQVIALTELLLHVEHSLTAPQDIEWCLAGGEFWLVQSRPITTFGAKYGTLAWSLSHPDIEWSRATALESLPELPKPQVSYAHCDLMERGVRGIAPELIAPVDELGPVVRLVLGRLYLNISQFKNMAHKVGRPAHPVATAHGGASHTSDTDVPSLTPGAVVRLLPRLLRLAGVWPPFQKGAWADLHGTRQRLDRLLHQDPRRLSDEAVFAEVAAPTSGAPLGLSDLLCGMTGMRIGTVLPVDFKLSLLQSPTAHMLWSPPAGGADAYLLQAIPLDGSPVVTVPLPGSATAFVSPPLPGAGACFQLIAFKATEFGTTNVLCGIPGISSIPGGGPASLQAAQQALQAVGNTLAAAAAGLR